MDSKCTFVPSSLSVSECDNGTWRELAKEQYKTALDLVDEGAGKQQRLTLKLPDKKYLKSNMTSSRLASLAKCPFLIRQSLKALQTVM